MTMINAMGRQLQFAIFDGPKPEAMWYTARKSVPVGAHFSNKSWHLLRLGDSMVVIAVPHIHLPQRVLGGPEA